MVVNENDRRGPFTNHRTENFPGVNQRGRLRADRHLGVHQVMILGVQEWRRARDSNPQGPRGPVDFKSTALPVEASPPCQEQQLLTIHHVLAGTANTRRGLVTG